MNNVDKRGLIILCVGLVLLFSGFYILGGFITILGVYNL